MKSGKIGMSLVAGCGALALLGGSLQAAESEGKPEPKKSAPAPKEAAKPKVGGDAPGKRKVVSSKRYVDKAFGNKDTKAWRQGRVWIHVNENIITNPETGKKDLQLKVDIESREQVFALGDLKVSVMVIGVLNGVDTEFLRMILNENETFTIKARKTHNFSTSIMESGEGRPSHINFGIIYRGFLVVVEDRNGDIIRMHSTNNLWEERFDELRQVKSNQNFEW